MSGAIKENISVVTKFADSDGRVMIVNLKGYVDQANSGKLQKVLDDIVSSGCFHVVFDLSQLYYISSAGWGIFVGEIRRFRESNGDIKIACMSPEVSQVFQMLEFFHIIEEYPTMNEALEAFGIVKEVEKKEVEKVKVKEEKNIFQEQLKKINVSKKETLNEVVDEDDDEALLERIKEEASEILNEDISIDEITEEKFIEAEEINLEKILYMPKRVIPLQDLPVSEKVKKIAGEFPLAGIFRIKKMLRHNDFGYTKIGILKLRKVMKELNLDTKAKRYRYYRSA